MVPDPTDAELIPFIAKFTGWTDKDLKAWDAYKKILDEWNALPRRESFSGLAVGERLERAQEKLEQGEMPDFLHSVDAFLLNVWPRASRTCSLRWSEELIKLVGDRGDQLATASARSMCLALWRALDGKLPGEEPRP
jgi:hypothetical protein